MDSKNTDPTQAAAKAVAATFKCKNCEQNFLKISVIPRSLPCDHCYCSECITNAIHAHKITCFECKKQFEVPADGFPINRNFVEEEFDKLQAVHEDMKHNSIQILNILLQKILSEANELDVILNFKYVAAKKIEEYCSNLRKRIKIRTDLLVDDIHVDTTNLEKQIDVYEKETKEWFIGHQNLDENAINRLVADSKESASEETDYMTDHSRNYTEKNLTASIKKATNIIKEMGMINKDELLFNKKKIESMGGSGTFNLPSNYFVSTFKSDIISEEQFNGFAKFMGKNAANLRLKLVYRATKDGFSADDFHSKCDGICDSMLVVKTAEGKIFGGFTEAQWASGFRYKSDLNACVFCFEVDGVQYSKCAEPDYAIYCDSSSCAIFGKGHDLFVSSNSNVNLDSYVKSASYPDVKISISKYGEHNNFRTAQVEVFQVSDIM